jgi:hypothetical protein
MKLAIYGVTGLKGGHVLSQALAEADEVVALSRDPRRISLEHSGLTVPGADTERCVGRANAVVHCHGIGGQGDGKPTRLISDSVGVVLPGSEGCRGVGLSITATSAVRFLLARATGRDFLRSTPGVTNQG